VAVEIDVNGQTINYPEIGDPNWADEATDFAVQTASAFGKLGLASGTSVDIPGTLDVTGDVTLDANLSVGGNASVTGNTTLTGNITVNGNSNLGNGSSDTIAVTGILNVDSGVLYVDPATNKVGINDTTPSVELDVNGSVAIGGTLNVTGATTLSNTLGVTGDITTSVIKASGSGGLTIDSNGGTDVALFGAGGGSGTTLYGGLNGTTATFSGVIYADDDTTANTPVLSFTGDTNTGIGRSAADTLDFITNGNSRFRIESTGQIKAVYESQVGTDYNTQLDNGYLCRAWVNFNGTGTVAIRASGNVSSITDHGTGDYSANFTTAMPDGNYSISACSGITPDGGTGSAGRGVEISRNAAINSSFVRVVTLITSTTAAYDAGNVTLAVFR